MSVPTSRDPTLRPAERREGFLVGAVVGSALAASTAACTDLVAIRERLTPGGRPRSLGSPAGQRRAATALADGLLEELLAGGVDLPPPRTPLARVVAERWLRRRSAARRGARSPARLRRPDRVSSGLPERRRDRRGPPGGPGQCLAARDDRRSISCRAAARSLGRVRSRRQWPWWWRRLACWRGAATLSPRCSSLLRANNAPERCSTAVRDMSADARPAAGIPERARSPTGHRGRLAALDGGVSAPQLRGADDHGACRRAWRPPSGPCSGRCSAPVTGWPTGRPSGWPARGRSHPAPALARQLGAPRSRSR